MKEENLDEKVPVRAYTKADLAMLYNPGVCITTALQLLRRWIYANRQLMAELKELETVERPKISAAIAEARDKGDLSENAEYDAAKEAQGMLEMRINKLKATIADAKIIDESKLKTDSVQILNKVELKNVKNGMKMIYTIVSESEANLKEGKISVNTPIAQGLLGKKVGDVAEITVPQGKIALEVVNISI